MNLALPLIAAVSGVGMVVCLAIGLCRAASDGDHAYHDACEQVRLRRRQEREARAGLRPKTGWVAAAPRLIPDLDNKTPRHRSHGPGLDR